LYAINAAPNDGMSQWERQMRIVQIVETAAPPFQKRLRELDAATLASKVELSFAQASGNRLDPPAPDADREKPIAHLYAAPGFSPGLLRRLSGTVIVAEAAPRRPRLPWLRAAPPAVILGAPPHSLAPEAVSEAWFALSGKRTDRPSIGVFARSDSVREMIAAIRARIERFRSDVRWTILPRFPEPGDMENLAIWLDPAPTDDHEGAIAEAMAAGRLVVATRTPANTERLGGGEAGFLFPPADPNEAVHALLAALFKPEASRPRLAAAARHSERFRASARGERLLEIYEGLVVR
jgi:hypothetical protein